MKTHLAIALSLFAASAAAVADQGEAITLRTLSGKTYRGVSVSKVDPDGVCFRHSNGAGKVLFSDMSSELRQSFGYDSKKAVAYEKELETRREKVRLARIERDREVAKAQTAAFQAASIRAMKANAMSDLNAGGGQVFGGGFLNAGWGLGGIGFGGVGFVPGDLGFGGSLGGVGYCQGGGRTGIAVMGGARACAPVHEYGSSVARVGISTRGYYGGGYGVGASYAPLHEYGRSVARVGLSTYGYGGYQAGNCARVHEYGRAAQVGFFGHGGYYGAAYHGAGGFRQPYSPVMPGGRLTNGVPSLGAGFSPSPAICAPGGGGAMFSAGR
jgi:hypothetical protein